METKKEIRKAVLKKRAQIPEDIWREKSDIIIEKVIEHPLFQNANTIYGYVSYNHEVDTWPLLESAWKLGKKVAVPKVIGKTMEFYYIHNFNELYSGMKGILEPAGEEARLAKDDDALIIMPLVGFDKDRNRLGYGGGYYDRYLEQHPDNTTMAIAFSEQEVDYFPSEETDLKPDLIITESSEVH